MSTYLGYYMYDTISRSNYTFNANSKRQDCFRLTKTSLHTIRLCPSTKKIVIYFRRVERLAPRNAQAPARRVQTGLSLALALTTSNPSYSLPLPLVIILPVCQWRNFDLFTAAAGCLRLLQKLTCDDSYWMLALRLFIARALLQCSDRAGLCTAGDAWRRNKAMSFNLGAFLVSGCFLFSLPVLCSSPFTLYCLV